MKIVADENIPYVHEFFSLFGQVTTFAGRSISAADVATADVLLVRSVTQVNEALLAGSSVKFVGTCTIGTDHMDTEFLDHSHIQYASAPGCNAGGVVQYDLAALSFVDPKWQLRSIGVIGHGNVGGRLCRTLRALGAEVCAYDPFLSSAEIPYLSDLDTVLKADVICMHTPYTTAGPHPTHHMIGAEQLRKISTGAILLNAGRGAAIDNEALLKSLKRKARFSVVLDVWEGEPQVDGQLMQRVNIATPHIAGYSYEGKLMGTAMIFKALADFLGHEPEVYNEQCHRLMTNLRGEPSEITAISFNDAVSKTYNILADDRRMRQEILTKPLAEQGKCFDKLRKEYPERREFCHHKVMTADIELAQQLDSVGFIVGT